MDKVYLVCHNETNMVCGVFSTREQADTFIGEGTADYYIEVEPVDPPLDRRVRKHFSFIFDKSTGQIEEESTYYAICDGDHFVSTNNLRDRFHVYVTTDDRDKAYTIAILHFQEANHD